MRCAFCGRKLSPKKINYKYVNNGLHYCSLKCIELYDKLNDLADAINKKKEQERIEAILIEAKENIERLEETRAKLISLLNN